MPSTPSITRTPNTSASVEIQSPTTSFHKPKNAKCGKCKNTVKQADKRLICEYCVQLFHVTCEHLTDDQYAAIVALGTQTHWFCQSCNMKAMDTIRFIQNVKDDNEQLRAEIGGL